MQRYSVRMGVSIPSRRCYRVRTIARNKWPRYGPAPEHCSMFVGNPSPRPMTAFLDGVAWRVPNVRCIMPPSKRSTFSSCLELMDMPPPFSSPPPSFAQSRGRLSEPPPVFGGACVHVFCFEPFAYCVASTVVATPYRLRCAD